LLAKERSDLEAAQTLRDQQESLIREANDGISRAKAKSAKAKNAREAEAVERELDAVRRSLKDREAERDKLNTAIEQVQKSLGQHETEFSGLRDVLAVKDADAQARTAVIEAKRREALHGRDELAVAVPREILQRYDALRARRGTGVAEAREGVCQGCRMSVRPMQYIVIQREEGIERCAQCQRYLYLGSWLHDDAAALEAGESGPAEPKR
jgi:predicted  nucleic acid-binding Zn-ribbon protein